MTAQPCDWRNLTCHDARTIADLAHRYGWMVVGSVTEPTWADSTGNTDQSLMLLMGAHDGGSAVRILAHWIDVDRHGIAHHDGCTIEDIDADPTPTTPRVVHHNVHTTLVAVIVKHGYIDLTAEVA